MGNDPTVNTCNLLKAPEKITICTLDTRAKIVNFHGTINFYFLGATAYVDAQTEDDLYDEVFEAFIDGREAGIDYLNRLDEDAQQTNELAKQSNQVLRELKRVLVYKAREHEIREAQALSRQRGEITVSSLDESNRLIDPFGLPIGQTGGNFPWVNTNDFDDDFIGEFSYQW